MVLDWDRAKAVLWSMLRYYGVLICSILIALPLIVIGALISEAFSSFAFYSETENLLLYPVMLVACIFLMLPVMILGLAGNYFLLFRKKKKKEYRPPRPAGYGQPAVGGYIYPPPRGGYWYGVPPGQAAGYIPSPPPPPPPDHPQVHPHSPPYPQPPPRDEEYISWDDGDEELEETKEEPRPFNLPPVYVSVLTLFGLLVVSILSYGALVAGASMSNAVLLLLLLLGASVFLIVFPILFTFPPFLWIQVLQKGKSLIVPQRTILTAFAWGIMSPVPVIISGFVLGFIYQAGSGSPMPDWISTPIITPIIEEFFKAFGLVLLFSRIRNQYDGLVIGFCCGIGFAVVENLLYFGSAAAEGLTLGMGDAVASWMFVAVVRSFKSTMSHGLGSAIIGFTLGFLIRGLKKDSWDLWFAPVLGYIIAVILHAVWNGVLVFIEIGLPQDVQESLLVTGGMIVWIIGFFIFELAMLLGLRMVAKRSEDAQLAQEEMEREKGKRRKERSGLKGRRRRPSTG